jgi:hypothetical protein
MAEQLTDTQLHRVTNVSGPVYTWSLCGRSLLFAAFHKLNLC